MKKVAVYPGTFDPITLGHMDVIHVAAKLFDVFIVAILINPRKTPMFSQDQRLAMIEESVKEAGLTNVRVVTFDGLAVELAERESAIALVRGLRLVTDYEAELQMSFANQKLAPDIHTVYIAPKQEHIDISSSAVRELLHFGRTKLEQYVPGAVLKYMTLTP
ncbi:Phosphopantetheine adenylyltransferase [subsurface metagenome]